MREALLQALRWSGLGALSRAVLARRGRFVLEFHGVSGLSPDQVEALPPSLRPLVPAKDLRAILQWLGPRFPLLTPREFLDGETPGVLLTFDDGFANQAEVALPILEQFRAPAVFFVATSHVADPGDWLPFVGDQLKGCGFGEADRETHRETLGALFDGMSLEQLKECARSPWIALGSHTVNHPFLSRCDDQELRRELEDSKAFLEKHGGATVDLLAYPTGDYDARVAEAARAAGYTAAFVEDSMGLGLGEFEIPRIGLYRADSAYLGAKLSGLHRRPLGLRRPTRDA